MTNKDFKEGMEVSFFQYGNLCKDGILHKDKGVGYVYPDNEFEEGTTRVNTDYILGIKPKLRTIDDLECGDYVVNESSGKKRCMGRCGEICFLSSPIQYNADGNEEGGGEQEYGETKSMFNLKKNGYTLYQPTEEKETDIDKCIKVVDDLVGDSLGYIKKELLQALKNLKK